MLDDNLLSLARDLRARAEEILTRAETMNDADARQKMREIAASYEKLAQRIEQRSLTAHNAAERMTRRIKRRIAAEDEIERGSAVLHAVQHELFLSGPISYALALRSIHSLIPVKGLARPPG
jgi:hypothetical protein